MDGLIYLLLQKIILSMLSVSNLSVQFGKRILFDEVNTSFNPEIAMELLAPMVLVNLPF